MTETEPRGPAQAESSEPAQPHDVFVSYSRADRETVVGLVAGLDARGLRTWVDLEDIPPSAEWMAEIRAAIEAADGYLVVVSPALASSEVCGQELELAREAGKRIVPMMVRTTDPGSVPGSLAALNWIDATVGELDGAELDGALDRAVGALRTDLDHVRAHTKLGVRAAEWERKDDTKALLLRGAEIAEAEAVVASSSDPRATPSQARYVQASRSAATRRQRGAIGAVAAALVVSLALSAFALVQRGEAQHNQALAEDRAQESRSRELAASAMAQLGNDPELSLLLAMEAARISPTTQSEDALRRGITATNIRTVIDEGTQLTGVAVSPDGSMIAASDREATATIWGASSGEKIGELVGHHRSVESVEFSPDGTLLVTASADGTARLWNAKTFDQLQVLRHRAAVYQARFSDDGSMVVTSSADSTTRIWDAATGREVVTIEGPGSIYAADISPDGRSVVTGSDGGDATIWNARSGEAIVDLVGHSTEGASAILDVAFSPDGSRVATASEDQTVRVWNARDGTLLQSLAHEGLVQALAFAPAGTGGTETLATADLTGAVRVWDLRTGLPIADMLGHPEGVMGVAWFASGDRVATAGLDGTIRQWDPGAGFDFEQLAKRSAWGAPFAPDGTAVAVVLSTGETSIRSWPLADDTHVVLEDKHAWWASFASDGRSIATAGSDGATRVWDVSTGKILRELKVDGKGVYTVDYDPSGDRVVTSSEVGTALIWDVRNETVLAELPSDDIVWSAAFSGNGERVATVSEDGFVRVWNASSGKAVLELDQGAPSQAVVFDETGERLAIATGATVRVVDSTTGEELAQLVGHRNLVYSAAFGPGGDLLVTAGQDGTVRVWDVRTGSEVIAYQADPFWATWASFTPDGTDIVTTGLTSGGVRLYACDVCGSLTDLLDAATTRVTRELTPEERATYLGSARLPEQND